MHDLIEQKKQLESQIETLDSTMNQEVQRVLKVFRTQKFENDSQFPYDTNSAMGALIHNHLWPNYFDSFEVEVDGELYAGGMYQGSMGYYEHETVRFPAAWLDMTDEALAQAMQEAWQAELDRRQIKKMVEKKSAYESARATFLRLQKEIEDVHFRSS